MKVMAIFIEYLVFEFACSCCNKEAVPKGNGPKNFQSD